MVNLTIAMINWTVSIVNLLAAAVIYGAALGLGLGTCWHTLRYIGGF